MKIRQGFVSNSSSSSFVIAVPAGMEVTEANMHHALYGTNEVIHFPAKYDWLETGGVHSDAVVASIISQIKYAGDQANTGKIAAEDLASVVDGEELDTDNYRGADGKVNWDLYEKDCDKLQIVEAARVMNLMKDHDFYEVEFSDNDGSFDCEVEHGPALHGLKNVVRYSHH